MSTAEIILYYIALPIIGLGGLYLAPRLYIIYLVDKWQKGNLK